MQERLLQRATDANVETESNSNSESVGGGHFSLSRDRPRVAVDFFRSKLKSEKDSAKYRWTSLPCLLVSTEVGSMTKVLPLFIVSGLVLGIAFHNPRVEK